MPDRLLVSYAILFSSFSLLAKPWFYFWCQCTQPKCYLASLTATCSQWVEVIRWGLCKISLEDSDAAEKETNVSFFIFLHGNQALRQEPQQPSWVRKDLEDETIRGKDEHEQYEQHEAGRNLRHPALRVGGKSARSWEPERLPLQRRPHSWTALSFEQVT